MRVYACVLWAVFVQFIIVRISWSLFIESFFRTGKLQRWYNALQYQICWATRRWFSNSTAWVVQFLYGKPPSPNIVQRSVQKRKKTATKMWKKNIVSGYQRHARKCLQRAKYCIGRVTIPQYYHTMPILERHAGSALRVELFHRHPLERLFYRHPLLSTNKSALEFTVEMTF